MILLQRLPKTSPLESSPISLKPIHLGLFSGGESTSLKAIKQGARNAWNPAFILPAKLHALVRASSISRTRHFLYTQCVSPSQVWRAVMAQRGAFSSFRWRQLLGNRWLCLPTGSPSSVLILFLSCSSPSSLFPQLPPISSPFFTLSFYHMAGEKSQDWEFRSTLVLSCWSRAPLWASVPPSVKWS